MLIQEDRATLSRNLCLILSTAAAMGIPDCEHFQTSRPVPLSLAKVFQQLFPFLALLSWRTVSQRTMTQCDIFAPFSIPHVLSCQVPWISSIP